MKPRSAQLASDPHETVAQNAFWLTLGQGLTLVLSIAWVLVLARALGAEQYGVFGLAAATAALGMTVADPGITPTTVRRANTGELTDIEVVLWSAFVLRLALSFIAAALIAAYAETLGPPSARTAIILYGLIIPVEAIHGTAVAAFRARQRMQFEAYSIVAFRIASIVVGLALLAAGAGTNGVVLGYIGASVVTSILSVIWVRRLLNRGISVHVDLRHAIGLLRESLPLGVGLLLTLIYFRIDVVLMGRLTTLREVGIYAAAYKAADALFMLQAPVSTAVFPLLTQLLKQDRGHALGLAGRVVSVTVLLASISLIVAVGFGDRLVAAVFGSDFRGSALVLDLLCLALIAMAFNGILNNLLIAAFHQRTVTLNALVLAGVNIAVNIMLIPRFGAVGAAVATIVVEFWLLLMSLFWLRHFGLDVVRVIIPAVLIAAGPVLSLILALQFSGLRIPIAIVAAALTIIVAVKTGTITSSTPRRIFNLVIGLRQTGGAIDPI